MGQANQGWTTYTLVVSSANLNKSTNIFNFGPRDVLEERPTFRAMFDKESSRGNLSACLITSPNPLGIETRDIILLRLI